MCIYSLALTVALLLSAPWWLLRMATTARYREGLLERLGQVPARLRAAVAGMPAHRCVWLHAVSVGEVLAASRLIESLEAALATEPGVPWKIVVSTTTRTGQALARERLGAQRVFYLPFDFAFAIRPYLRLLRPAAFVLMESEVWPRLLHECRSAGVPVAVVNARVSDRSFARAMRVRRVWSRVLRGVTLWLAQSEEDATRLCRLGASKVAMKVAGNLKYDVQVPAGSPMAAALHQLAGGRKVLIAGSTVAAVKRAGLTEDEMVIQAWKGRLRAERVLLVLAPRHPERFDEVLAVASEFRVLRASEVLRVIPAHPLNFERPAADEVEIVVLDTIGDLASVYSVADVAFVGGSMVPRGGHNPLEPAQFGVPAVIGVSYENFRSIVGTMKAAEGIAVVEGVEELEQTLIQLLTHPDTARAMGRRGQQVFERQQGATARTTAALVEMISAGYGDPLHPRINREAGRL